MELSWDDVRAILVAIDASPLEELELEVGDLRLVVRKRPSPVRPAPGGGATIAAGPSADLGAGAGGPAARGRAGEGEFELKAPSVGVFRRSPAGSGRRLVEPGVLVSADEVLGLIEAAGEARDVRAPGTARLVVALVEDGEFVEYGQALMILRPVPRAEP